MPTFERLPAIVKDALCYHGFWYVATPYAKYAKGHHQAFVDAAKVAAALFDAGVPVFSPIAHSHPLAEHGKIDNVDHRKWLDLDLHFMESAVGIVVVGMDGWDESKGVKEEIEYFDLNMAPILYLSTEGIL